MADEGDQIQMEHQSNAGKWILTVLAILVVAASAYAHYASHLAVEKLTSDLNASQAQVKELQNRMQTAEETRRSASAPGRHDQAGVGAKHGRAARRAESHGEPSGEENRKRRSAQVTGEISGVKRTWAE